LFKAVLNQLKSCIISQMELPLKKNKIVLTGKGILEALEISRRMKKTIFIAFDIEGKYRKVILNKRFTIYLLPFRPNLDIISTNVCSFLLNNIKGYIKNIGILIKILSYEKPDVTKVENVLLVGFPVYIASKISRKPYFLWVAGPELKIIKMKLGVFPPIRKLLSIIYKLMAFLVIRDAKIVVNISPESEKLFLSLKPKKYISLRSNYVNTGMFYPDVCKMTKDKKVVLYVGRLEKEKGIKLMLDAIEYLSEYKKRRDFELWIIGYGSLQKYIEARSKRLSIKIKIFGKKDIRELPKYYNCADIVLIPSLVRGPSASLLEAMSCGTAIISTTGPIKHLQNGIIVNKNSYEIAEWIEKLLDNKKLRKKLCRAARKFVENMSNHYLRTIFKVYSITAERIK